MFQYTPYAVQSRWPAQKSIVAALNVIIKVLIIAALMYWHTMIKSTSSSKLACFTADSVPHVFDLNPNSEFTLKGCLFFVS